MDKSRFDINNYEFKVEGTHRIAWAKNFFWIGLVSILFTGFENAIVCQYCMALSAWLYQFSVKPIFKK
jgi:hypothetical protein